MAIESKNLVVAAKVYSRGIAAPLDASSVYTSLSEAQTYAQNPIAYAGQIITVLENNKYVPYILDGEAGSYTLSKVGVDASAVKNYVQVVGELPSSGQEQGVIYINTTDSKGYIYNGSEFVVIFEDVTNEEGESLSEQLAAIETKFNEYARLDSATFTGTVTLAAEPTQDMQAATKHYVDALVAGLNDFTVGVVNSSTPLPTENYKVGQAFRVAEAGTYAGQVCEIGDLIIVVADYADSAKDSDFLVVQANTNGVVIGPDSAIDANIAVFDGVTGKKIKDSTVTIASVSDAIAKAHEHANKEILDSFTSTQTQIETAYKQYADEKVAALGDVVTNEELTTALEDYYTKTDVDGLLTPITTNLNTKVSTEELAEQLCDFGDSTVKDYIDTAVGSGGADVAEQILAAKNEAIETAKTYTDNALTITEF